MAISVDNAIILAAGVSSRFAPLSYEMPKALIQVKGEILIERQIHQLREAGIQQVIIVTGYKHEAFDYLRDQEDVILLWNSAYHERNNHSSIYLAKDYIRNSYICSSDNYFTINPFEKEVKDAYYAAVYAKDWTNEWCLTLDANDHIKDVQISGENAWYMLGHVFWDEKFSRKFMEILEREYLLPETKSKLWESIYIDHIDELDLKVRRYAPEEIMEFDSLEELRLFDSSYKNHSQSKILQGIAHKLNCEEEELQQITVIKGESEADAIGFSFAYKDAQYQYFYTGEELRRIS